LKKIFSNIIGISFLIIFILILTSCLAEQGHSTTRTFNDPVSEKTEIDQSITLIPTSSETTNDEPNIKDGVITETQTPSKIVTSEPSTKDGVLTGNAAPVGVTLQFLISPRPYSQYGTGNFTLYVASLTLLDVFRGDDACKYLEKNINYPSYLNQPANGLEYICTRFKFECKSREPQATQSYKLKQGEFLMYSTDKIMYENVPFILPWKSDVKDYEIFPGDSIEITIVSLLEKNDLSPLMYCTSGSRWFALH
jgi:hypothetical protein